MRPITMICAVALMGGLAGARADNLPKRKSGLWEVTLHMASGTTAPQVMKLCIDEATDATLFKFGMNAVQGMCSRNDLHGSGSVFTMDTECRMGDMKLTSHAVMTFTGDTAYRTDVQSHFDPPMMGRSDSSMTQEAKWTGPCPADMAPGDIVGPNGVKMNVRSLGQ
jgi:hypothetical protein